MQPIVTDVCRTYIGMCVCMSVCLCVGHTCAVQKRLNRSRCRLGVDLCGSKDRVMY